MPVPAPMPSAPISGSNGPWLNELEIEAHRAEAKRKRAARPWSSYLSDDSIRYYAGPHLWEALQKVKTATEIFSPGADMVDATENYSSAIQNARSGDIQPALRDFGYGLLSNIGLSEVSQPSKAIFAGVMSKAADHAKLQKAHKLAKSGADEQTIWNDTGWAQGADGRWRYEISDRQSRIMPHELQEIGSPDDRQWQGRVSDLLDHPELYKAYPELADIDLLLRYRRDKNESRLAYFDYAPKSGRPAITIEKFGPLYLPMDSDELKSRLFHELQHSTQWLEGFAPGGNLDSRDDVIKHLFADTLKLGDAAKDLERRIDGRAIAANKIEEARRKLDRLKAGIQWNERKLIDLDELSGFQVYHRLAGEVEARNVAARRALTPRQRLARPPWLGEEYPKKMQFLLPPVPR